MNKFIQGFLLISVIAQLYQCQEPNSEQLPKGQVGFDENSFINSTSKDSILMDWIQTEVITSSFDGKLDEEESNVLCIIRVENFTPNVWAFKTLKSNSTNLSNFYLVNNNDTVQLKIRGPEVREVKSGEVINAILYAPFHLQYSDSFDVFSKRIRHMTDSSDIIFMSDMSEGEEQGLADSIKAVSDTLLIKKKRYKFSESIYLGK